MSDTTGQDAYAIAAALAIAIEVLDQLPEEEQADIDQKVMISMLDILLPKGTGLFRIWARKMMQRRDVYIINGKLVVRHRDTNGGCPTCGATEGA